MKRSIIALLLAGFAAVAFAQSTGERPGAGAWSQDHSFIAPPQ